MKKSKSPGPRFVEPTKKGRYYFVIVILLAISIALGYFLNEARNENSDLKDKLKASTTSTTTSIPRSTTTTTSPQELVAKIDVIARNNDSNRTTQRIRDDFKDQVEVTQVPSTSAIAETVIVVNNPDFEELAQQITQALSGTLGLVPEGQQASVADIVVYVKS